MSHYVEEYEEMYAKRYGHAKDDVKAIDRQETAWQTQVGGDHYTKLTIQPMEYSMKNKLDPLQHTVIKYVTRFRDKNGIEDLQKAIDCIKMLIEWEESKA